MGYFNLNIMKKILFLVSILFISLSSFAQERFECKEFSSSEGTVLKYRLLEPKQIKKGKKYPLVLFLHGAGERGSDNKKQLIHGSQMFLNPVNRDKYPAFVLFPQCPKGITWAYRSLPKSLTNLPAEDMTYVFRAVKELLDSYLANPLVDKSRIYIMGLSMGAMGTYDMVARFPEIFAAAIPICGAVAPGRLAPAKYVKFRIFHGDADDTVPVEASRAVYRELKEVGASVEYIEFPGCGHNSWNPAFNQPDFMKWLFAQKKHRKNR